MQICYWWCGSLWCTVFCDATWLEMTDVSYYAYQLARKSLNSLLSRENLGAKWDSCTVIRCGHRENAYIICILHVCMCVLLFTYFFSKIMLVAMYLLHGQREWTCSLEKKIDGNKNAGSCCILEFWTITYAYFWYTI